MPCQQDALYRAEETIPVGRWFATQEEMQDFVDDLHNRLWHNHEPWGDDFSNVVRIEVYCRDRGKASIGAFQPEHHAGVIEMLPCHRNELIILHEISHVLAAARYGSHSHDPWFARTYLNLVYAVMGSETYKPLYDSFISAGIDCDTDD